MKDLPKVEGYKTEEEFLDAFDLFIDFKTKVEKSVNAESEELNEFKLVALKYSLKNSPVYTTITTDGRATYDSLRRKVKLFFKSVQEPCSHFFKLSICDYPTVDEYLLECRRSAKALLGEGCPNEYIEKLIIQLTTEQFTPSFQCVLKPRTVHWAEFVEHLKNIDIKTVLKCGYINRVTPKVHENSITCFNCGFRGHMSYNCNRVKAKCEKCNRFGHMKRFCRFQQD